MAEYRVAHSYRSEYHGFIEGDLVEVEDTVAEWVNRDSPGTLELVDATPAEEPHLGAEPVPPVEGGRGGRKRGA